jgi:hypothetical protein
MSASGVWTFAGARLGVRRLDAAFLADMPDLRMRTAGKGGSALPRSKARAGGRAAIFSHLLASWPRLGYVARRWRAEFLNELLTQDTTLRRAFLFE